MALTTKQEKFAEKFIELGNATQAYRLVYKCGKMKPATINRAAKELTDHPKISARVKEIKARHAKKHEITVDSITRELEEARVLAKETETPASMVTASMGKAKLHGLIVDKQEQSGDLNIKFNIIGV